jgi:hypothetical protein
VKPCTQPFTLDEARAALDYDPLTGWLTWQRDKVDRRGRVTRRIGKRAGSLHPSGYRTVYVAGKGASAHRVAWLLMTGEWPMFELDHADLDKTNNVWTNLRPADRAGQAANRLPSSGRRFKGVKPAASGRWIAHYGSGSKHIGMFDTEEQAARAYDRAAAAKWGAYARLNFPN